MSCLQACPLSIPAWFDWRQWLRLRWLLAPATFNPSLVRLARQVAGPILCPASSAFQSQLGSIGARHPSQPTYCRSTFQSQLGSIGAGDCRHFQDYEWTLSIPAWFDWRFPSTWNPPRRCSLSIPAWFDWRSWLDIYEQGLALLSIPAWFDWRVASAASDQQLLATFNPSLVRLARSWCASC